MSEWNQKWSQEYNDMINRNIGFITEEKQEQLRTSKISILGMGGIGGIVFEILVRSGIENFSIADMDIYESSNMNRQIFAFRKTMGRKKTDVAEEWAKEINSQVKTEKYDKVDENNIAEILKGSNVAVLAIDELKPCLIISRKAREMDIPLVEGWGIPFANVRTFTSQTPTLEDAYGLPTKNRPISTITEQELNKLEFEVLIGLGKIEGIPDFYNDEAVQRIAEGHIPTFAPVVWLTSVLMALEVIKILLNWGKIAKGPMFTLYDPFNHRVPKIFDDIPADRKPKL